MNRLSTINRRVFVAGTTVFSGFAGVISGARLLAAPPGKAGNDSAKVYTRLGLRPIINASGTYTHLGGSLLPPEVLEAMNAAAHHYVPIRDLTKAVGDRIAQLTGE